MKPSGLDGGPFSVRLQMRRSVSLKKRKKLRGGTRSQRKKALEIWVVVKVFWIVDKTEGFIMNR